MYVFFFLLKKKKSINTSADQTVWVTGGHQQINQHPEGQMASSKWTSSAFSLKATLYFHLRWVSTQQKISSAVIREQQLQDLSLFRTVGELRKEERGGSGRGRDGCKKTRKWIMNGEGNEGGMVEKWRKGKRVKWTDSRLRRRREMDDKQSE